MGASGSKNDRSDALLLCKDRMRFTKQAIDSRFALSAAHLSYIESLRSVGVALRQFAEAEISESPVSISEPDKSPSHSSYASPSPSGLPELSGSPCLSASPLSPQPSRLSYMRATRGNAVTIAIDPTLSHFIEEDDSLTFPLPPPPPHPDAGSPSWDFFDPTDAMSNARFLSNGGSGSGTPCLNFNRLMMGQGQFHGDGIMDFIEEEPEFSRKGSSLKPELQGNSGGRTVAANACEIINGDGRDRTTREAQLGKNRCVNYDERCNSHAKDPDKASARITSSELQKPGKENDALEKEMHAVREDPSEFITHRAKDFLSSIKDIEHRFLRAAEGGNEVSRMLETKKIRLTVSPETTSTSMSLVLSAFHINCCQTENNHDCEPSKNVTKVITWKRSVSSQSSSSRNPLTSASKDEIAESVSDFTEDFCMISGSHSSTLDRLYAWERKLHDEVKASEFLRKTYDHKCVKLRHQFAKDANSRVIEKTRSIVKDLHSRLTVAVQAVDSISRRIERLRDEELQPQLAELIMGLIRMWRTMLECHHTQHITMSLAYQAKTLAGAPGSESSQQAFACLRSEMDCFSSAFSSWVSAQKAYAEATSNWLQKCVLQPQERSRGRRVVFSPRRLIAPPIFVLCRDWFAGIGALPFDELRDSIQAFVSELDKSFHPPTEDKKDCIGPDEEAGEKDEAAKSERLSKLGSLQGSLARIFDRLRKFSEAALKLYEDVKRSTEAARNAYTKTLARESGEGV